MRKKSQEQKEMSGTFEPSKEGTEAVEYAKYDRLPVVPKGWPPDAGLIWSRTCEELKNTGYLARAFMPSLRRYCFAVYQAQIAEKFLMGNGGLAFVSTETGTEGQSYEVVSKWLTVLDSANRTILSIGSKFGFTPIDAVKVPRIKKHESKEESLLN